MLGVSFVTCDFCHAHAILLAGTDAHRHAVLDVKHGIGRNTRLDKPSEHEILVFLGRRETLDLVFLVRNCTGRFVGDLAVAVGWNEVLWLAGICAE